MMNSPEHGTPNSVPFFILGAQRSGTTMLRLMINNHPRLAVPHETGFMTALYPKLSQYGDLRDRENADRLLAEIERHQLVVRGEHIPDRIAVMEKRITSYASLIDAIMGTYAERHGKQRWGDKTPFYTADIDILWKIFPSAKFIHLVRDGRDVLLSQRKIEWLSNNLPRLAQDWQYKTLTCHKVGTVLGPNQYLELRYEDLVESTESTLRRICDFLEEDFAPSMLTYHEAAQEIVPGESLKWHTNSVQAPAPEKLYRWKTDLKTAERILYEQYAGDALNRFGYELEGRQSSLMSKIYAIYYALVQRW